MHIILMPYHATYLTPKSLAIISVANSILERLTILQLAQESGLVTDIMEMGGGGGKEGHGFVAKD